MPNDHWQQMKADCLLIHNSTSDAYCHHCANRRLVILDTVPEYGAPCPMCELGMAIDRSRKWWGLPDVDPSQGVASAMFEGFWDKHKATQYTWNNGKTWRHKFCSDCGHWHTGRVPHDCSGGAVARANAEAARAAYRRPRLTTVAEKIGKERAGV